MHSALYTVILFYKLIQTVHDDLPELYPFIYACYSDSAVLLFGETVLSSSEGAQQGDPLGSLLFSLASFKQAKVRLLNLRYMVS